ncbi:MAG: cell surface protein [Muribaculum sp.]|nr:cell surface protein [Muribaculaceae bacterium]MCM1081357.1 cell surface protein [Muribaculum sp.]
MKASKILKLVPLLSLIGCSDDVPTVNLGLDDVYYIARMQKLKLDPALTGQAYEWKVDGSVVSHNRDYDFISANEGTFNLSFEIIDKKTPYKFNFIVNVLHEEIEYSPYIAHVLEYCPAPGQFINELPKYEAGDTYDDILQKVEESISGTNDVMISLGGYGGYVTFAFDHTVMNVSGQKDFQIWGNAFYEQLNPGEKGGSAEPGIVMVSYDSNNNGLPDDQWYELAGSEYYKPATKHNYRITYHRPASDHTPQEDETGFLTDVIYIPWEDSEGQTGYIMRNSFHPQEYFPLWVNESTLSFTGSLLAPNGKDSSGSGSYFVLYSYDWGYVDNHPNEFEDLNSFDISWAVDSNGNPVELQGADFIRVYTGLNQYCGWLGETSTELSKARDLHIDLPTIK